MHLFNPKRNSPLSESDRGGFSLRICKVHFQSEICARFVVCSLRWLLCRIVWTTLFSLLCRERCVWLALRGAWGAARGARGAFGLCFEVHDVLLEVVCCSNSLRDEQRRLQLRDECSGRNRVARGQNENRLHPSRHTRPGANATNRSLTGAVHRVGMKRLHGASSQG